jgi:hypothetical protein
MGGTGRRAMLGLGGLGFFGGLSGVVFAAFSSADDGSRYAWYFIGGLFALLGLPLLVSVWRTRVWLHADHIETRGIFVTKRMERGDIAGRRLLSGEYGPPMLHLVPEHSRVGTLKIPQYLATDAAWDEWMQAIPDIDAQQAKASLEAVLADAELVGTRDDKLAALERAHRIAKWFRWATFAVSGWLWFYPHPYDLAIACAVILPLMAVVVGARGGALYKFNPRPNDVGADISVSVMLPGFVLMLRALFDAHVFDWRDMLLATIAVAGGLTLILWLTVDEMRTSAGSTALFALLLLPYVYGTVTLANMEFDHSEPVPYEARVLGSHISSGRTKEYYLKLGPWGPRKESDDVDVGRDYYQRGSRRETVCVYLFRGAFGIRWFQVWDCPRS